MKCQLTYMILVTVFVGNMPSPAWAQNPIGIFEDHLDFGNPYPPGTAEYNSATHEYTVTSGGAGYTSDFHFVYSEITGDFSLKAKITAEDLGGSTEWAAAGLTVPADLTPGCLFFSTQVTIHGIALERSRLQENGDYVQSGTVPSSVQDGRLEIVREGNTFHAFYIDKQTGEHKQVSRRTMNLPNTVYAGFMVSSFQSGGTTKGYFREVELKQTSSTVKNWELYE